MPLSHLFLSHSSADDGFVRELRQALADLGQEVWIDSRQLKGGDPLWSEIQAAIEAASGLAVLVSAASLQSKWVGKELLHGLRVQKERGRKRFAVVPLSLDRTRLGVLEQFFEEEPTYIAVSSAPGGATAAMDDILVALGLRLPADRPQVVQRRPEPVEELVLELSNLRFLEEDGKRRAAGTAQLIYQPATAGQREVESGKWRLDAPLGPIEAEDLSWYLERWAVWPNPVVAERAQKVEANLMAWGQALHAAALPPEYTAAVLQAWAGVGANTSRRFSVSVDPSLEAGVSDVEKTTAQEAATALLALPWELLHSGDGFLFQGARPTRVRRRLPNTRNLSVPVVAPPIRVLLITARPEDDACGYIDHRASAGPMVAATEELGEALQLTLLHPATYAGLEAELARAQQAGQPYHVVHFDGHGVYDSRVGLGGLCFEDPSDRHKLTGRLHETVFTDRLGPLFTGYRIPLVFLGACQSAQAGGGGESVATELLQRGVASVVAMSHSVLVETARRFVAAFYGELARGQRVGQAMLAGQRALHSDPNRGERYGIGELTLADWFVPVLYQEENDPQLFTAIPSPQTKEDQQARLRTWLREVPEEPLDTGFVGRSRDLLALERLLRQERWAVVRGQGGEGKTALAAELARWLVRSQQVKRAAFVSVEVCGHQGAVLDALGRQLVGGDYSAAKFANSEQALLAIERALKEQATLLVIDNMESLLLPPYLEAPELLSEAAAEELQGILTLAQRMSQVGKTRIVFTSREALPAPFNAERQRRELRQLERSDALALIEASLRAGDSKSGVAAPEAVALEAQREEIEALVDAVQGHARTLALLGPELRRRGVAATQAALVELMEQMQRQVAHLPAEDPRRREQSLFASLELSLRRLSAENRERVRVLGVFHGGVNLDVLRTMTGWEPADVEMLAEELVGTGLATANPYNHLSLNPALCPYLQASLSAVEQGALTARWLEAMGAYLGYLDQQRNQNTQLAATLTQLDMPNLFAFLDLLARQGKAGLTMDGVSLFYKLLGGLGKPKLLARLQQVSAAIGTNLDPGWTHEAFVAIGNRMEALNHRGQVSEALNVATQRHKQALAAGPQAYVNAAYDLAYSCFDVAGLLKTTGHVYQALTLFQESRQRFQAFASEWPGMGAERMAAVCLTEQGICCCELGRFDEAAQAHIEGIRLAQERGDERQQALGKLELGIVRAGQRRFGEALVAYEEARGRFLQLNELGMVSLAWFNSGNVYCELAQGDSAEEAYSQSLAIDMRLGDRAGQAGTLSQLGILYAHILHRLEEAVGLYRRAAKLYASIGDGAGEARVLGNVGTTLRLLGRFREARRALRRALECCSPFSGSFSSWLIWDSLAENEAAAGNAAASAEARQEARNAYLVYRRDGGENLNASGRLSASIRQDLTAGMPSAAGLLLQQLASNPEWAKMLPYLMALRAIIDGSRDPSLADNPGLDFDQAAEVLLLIEALKAGSVR
jgi:tetratricopeptide (TPR) repeat protein